MRGHRAAVRMDRVSGDRSGQGSCSFPDTVCPDEKPERDHSYRQEFDCQAHIC